MHHLPTYIRGTRVEKVMLTIWNGGDIHNGWFTLDAMITEALVAYPRPSFMLHVKILSLPKPDGEEYVWSSLPRCSALGVLDFVSYDNLEVVPQNQMMATSPLLSAFAFPQYDP